MTGHSIPCKILCRSLLIHSCWNVNRLQNVGFAFSLLPLLGKREGDGPFRRAFLARHLERFQCNPYLSAPILGSVAVLEGEGASAPGEEKSRAVRLKGVLAGPYAALGDPFFWGALKPFSMVLAVLLAANGHPWGILAGLLVYNALHGYIRIGGFFEGFRDGHGAAAFLRRLELPRWTARLRWAALLPAALYGGLSPGAFPSPGSLDIYWRESLAAFGFLLFVHCLVRERVSVLYAVYGTAIAAFGLALIS
jgi:PTS system mannose-specific IID component